MRTIIFRTIAPYLSALMVLFSIFVLLRGHNEPGGGFIGGLIAASALAIFGIACGVASVRRAIVFHPMGVSGFGLFLAAVAGIPSIFKAQASREERLAVATPVLHNESSIQDLLLRINDLHVCLLALAKSKTRDVPT